MFRVPTTAIYKKGTLYLYMAEEGLKMFKLKIKKNVWSTPEGYTLTSAFRIVIQMIPDASRHFAATENLNNNRPLIYLKVSHCQNLNIIVKLKNNFVNSNETYQLKTFYLY